MTTELKPIVITPEQIIAAAQLIANASDDGWEYSENDWLRATSTWLRVEINNLLMNAGVRATCNGSDFSIKPECDYPNCHGTPLEDDIFCHYHREIEDELGRRWEADTATQFIVPPAPEWASDPIRDGAELPF